MLESTSPFGLFAGLQTSKLRAHIYMKQLIDTLVVAMVAGQVFATPISFPDGNFETGTQTYIYSLDDGSLNTAQIAGWTAEAQETVGAQGYTQTGVDVESGNHYGSLANTLVNTTSRAAFISPELGAFAASRKYTVSWNTKSFAILWQHASTQVADMGVEILDGNGHVVAALRRNAYVAQVEFNNDFQPVQMTFTTGTTPPVGQMRIRVYLVSGINKSFVFMVDDFTIDAVELPPVVTPPPQEVAAPKVTVPGGTIKAVDKPQVTLKGKATGSVTRVEYRVRKGLKSGKAIKVAKGKSSWKFTVKLRKGQNVFEVRSVGPGGKSPWKRITVKG